MKKVFVVVAGLAGLVCLGATYVLADRSIPYWIGGAGAVGLTGLVWFLGHLHGIQVRNAALEWCEEVIADFKRHKFDDEDFDSTQLFRLLGVDGRQPTYEDTSIKTYVIPLEEKGYQAKFILAVESLKWHLESFTLKKDKELVKTFYGM